MKHCTLTGIVKKLGGYGFSVVFSNAKDAQKYKDMFAWILKDDKFKLTVKGGYYDKR